MDNEQDFNAISPAELARMKHGLVRDLLDVTKSAVFEQDEFGADVFVAMINKREGILNEVLAVDVALKKRNAVLDKEVQTIAAETDGMLREIVSLDEKNQQACQSILVGMKDSLRSLSSQKSANTAYQSNLAGYSNSSFDRQK